MPQVTEVPAVGPAATMTCSMVQGRPWIHAIGLALLAVWLLVDGQASASIQQPKENVLPDAPGRAVVERACTTCHGAGEMTSRPRTTAAWREVLELMRGYGADATDDDWKTVTVYIMDNLALLSVNQAPADDLGAVLGVDPKTAEGIVAYRDKQGGFKSIDDLKRAPGVDERRLDAVKERLRFEANSASAP